MRITPLVAVVLAAALFFGSFGSNAAETKSVTVADAWARATTPTMRAGAAYLTLSVATGSDELIAATSAGLAEKIELHAISRDGDVVKMRPVTAIPVSAATPTVLAPGGFHIMLIGLKRPLMEGQSFSLTLTFRDAGKIETQVTIRAPGAELEGHGTKHMKM